MSEFSENMRIAAIPTKESREQEILEMLRFLPWLKDYFEKEGFKIGEFREYVEGCFEFCKDETDTYMLINRSKSKKHIFRIGKTPTGYMTEIQRARGYSKQTYNSEGIEIERIVKCDWLKEKYTWRRDIEFLEKVSAIVNNISSEETIATVDISRAYPFQDIATLDGVAGTPETVGINLQFGGLKTWYPEERKQENVLDACNRSKKKDACLGYGVLQQLQEGIEQE